jgi:hypothetical protein
VSTWRPRRFNLEQLPLPFAVVDRDGRPLAVGDLVTIGRTRRRYRVVEIDPKALDLVEVGGTGHRTPAPSTVRKVTVP